MNFIKNESCPKGKHQRAIYDNFTTYCEHCNIHTDVGLLKYESKKLGEI